MEAEADTEAASLDGMPEAALLSSSDMVGMSVGVEGMEVQAERNNVITVKRLIIRSMPGLDSVPVRARRTLALLDQRRSARYVFIFFILTLRLSVGFTVFCDQTVLQGHDAVGITNDAWVVRGKDEGRARFLIQFRHDIHDLFAVLGI